MRALIALSLIGAPVFATWPFAAQYGAARQASQSAGSWIDATRQWPIMEREGSHAQTDAYNRSIVTGGQEDIGTAFNGDKRAETIGRDENLVAQYESALNPSGDGVMGVVSIPEIGLVSQVWHGTDASVLEHDMGHLYGTSLPTGLPGTRAVLAAHNGLPARLLFTRIDELKEVKMV